MQRLAGLALGRAEEVYRPETEQVALLAADVRGEDRHPLPQRRQDAIQQAGGDQAVAEVGEDDGGRPVGGRQDAAGEQFFLSRIRWRRRPFVHLQHLGLIDKKAVLDDDALACARALNIDAAGLEADGRRAG